MSMHKQHTQTPMVMMVTHTPEGARSGVFFLFRFLPPPFQFQFQFRKQLTLRANTQLCAAVSTASTAAHKRALCVNWDVWTGMLNEQVKERERERERENVLFTLFFFPEVCVCVSAPAPAAADKCCSSNWIKKTNCNWHCAEWQPKCAQPDWVLKCQVMMVVVVMVVSLYFSWVARRLSSILFFSTKPAMNDFVLLRKRRRRRNVKEKWKEPSPTITVSRNVECFWTLHLFSFLWASSSFLASAAAAAAVLKTFIYSRHKTVFNHKSKRHSTWAIKIKHYSQFFQYKNFFKTCQSKTFSSANN